MSALAIWALVKRAAPWIGVLGVLGTVAVLYFLWQSADARADRLAIEVRTEQALRIAAERRTATLERASTERARDTAELATLQKDLTDAITAAAAKSPGAAPGPATTALGCARMRAAGRTASAEYRRLCSGR